MGAHGSQANGQKRVDRAKYDPDFHAAFSSTSMPISGRWRSTTAAPTASPHTLTDVRNRSRNQSTVNISAIPWAAICPDAHLGHGAKATAVLERLKQISGEDSVEVHRKYMPSLPAVRLRVKFTLAVNNLPNFEDSSGEGAG